MTDQAEDVSVNDVTDEQFDKFFEQGGEVAETEAPQEEVQAQEPEPVKEEKQEEKPEEKYVPLAALHEERMRRKEMQEELRRIQEHNKRMEERFSQVIEKVTPKQQLPSYEEDPLGYQQAKISQLEQTLTQQTQTFEQQRYANEIAAKYRADAMQFQVQTPDFEQAYAHAIGSLRSEMAAYGYQPHEIDQYVSQQELGIAAKALQDGVSPAERMYRIAEARGYRKQEAKSENKQAEQKIQQIEKGVQASKSLAGGGASPQSLSLEALASLPDDEFDRQWDKMVRG